MRSPGSRGRLCSNLSTNSWAYPLGLPSANAFAPARVGRTRHDNFKVVYTTGYDDFAASEAMHKPIDQDMLLRRFAEHYSASRRHRRTALSFTEHSRGAMLGYRCYFLGMDALILAMRDFHADNNAEALAMARTLALDSKSHSFELWEGSHFVHSEDC